MTADWLSTLPTVAGGQEDRRQRGQDGEDGEEHQAGPDPDCRQRQPLPVESPRTAPGQARPRDSGGFGLVGHQTRTSSATFGLYERGS
jgi:hypothetical protein